MKTLISQKPARPNSFKASDYSISRKGQRNLAKVLELEERMFELRSRYLVLNLTLNYQPRYRPYVSFQELCFHRDRLLNGQRFNSLLSGIQGYAWKIEQGESSGLHLHLVIFYDGRCRADVSIAKRIGDYWVDVVTEGRGAFWNCNADKDYYQRNGFGVGTGQIDRNNFEKREALRNVLRYIAKDDQAVTSKPSRYHRTFGTSQIFA